MKLPFKIKQVKSNIFLFEFTDQYELCMNFLRYQEFYESPNVKFRNKFFTIFDFMKWQAQTYGSGNFTYTTQWSGFNIPSTIVNNCLKLVNISNDCNEYDRNILTAYNQCSSKVNGENFYIIGARKGEEATLNHEIAHGYFYLNSSYKKEMTQLVKALPSKFRKDMDKMLINSGYTKQVFIDEIQAYYSTTEDLHLFLNSHIGVKYTVKNIDKLKKIQESFIELFYKYS